MCSAERILTWVLRLQGAILVLALGAVFLPTSWMALIHHHLDMGQFPRAPLVEYLTRSVSGLYGYWGLVYFYLSQDVRRFAGLIRYMNLLGMVFAIGLLILDAVVGMPVPWISIEGPLVFLLCLTVWLLARQIPRQSDACYRPTDYLEPHSLPLQEKPTTVARTAYPQGGDQVEATHEFPPSP